jgi:SRSO17 transposase
MATWSILFRGGRGRNGEGSSARSAAHVEALGRADRQEPMRDYCLGQLMPIACNSEESIAAVMAPARVATKHQSLLNFGGNAPWPDAAMLARVSELMLSPIERSGPVETRIIGDTGFPKKGRHSVGMNRQYCVRSVYFVTSP